MASKRWNLGFFLFLALLTVGIAGCGSSAGVQATDGIFKILNKSPAKIVMEVNPSTLPADGASAALVMARVYNDEGYLVSTDVQVSFSVRLSTGASDPGSGKVPEQVACDITGVARAPFTAGLVPGKVTIVARAGEAIGTIDINLIPTSPRTFVTSVTPAAGTTDAFDVAVDLYEPYFLHTGLDVKLQAVDQNGAALASTFQPSTGVAVDGRYTARLFLGPLTPEQQRAGVRGYVITTIGDISRLTPFNLAPGGTGTGGGSTAPVFPDSVVMTPSSLRMAVRSGSTIAVPVSAQFPSSAIGANAVFSLNPGFRTAQANGITGYFTPCPTVTPSCDTQVVPISSTGTATTTLVLTNVTPAQIASGIVLAVNVRASRVVNNVDYQFAGSAPVTLYNETPELALLAFSVDPTRLSIPAGGSFSVQLRARVQANNGSFPAGVFVNFSSSQSNGVIYPTTAATDATGVATATFSMNQVPASLLASGMFVTLTAQTAGASGSTAALSATTSIFISPSFGSPDHLVLSSSIQPNPTTNVIFVQGSIFPTVTQVTFDILDINDNVARSSTDRVKFVLENGGLHSGESLEPGSGTAATTGAMVLNGRASTVLRSGVRAGTVRIIAFIDNVIVNGRPDPTEPRSEPVTVSISGGLPSGQNLSLIPRIQNIPGLLAAGIFDYITAYLADRFNNPVIAGTRVSFTSFDAITLDSAAQVTASSGTAPGISQATATLQSQEPRPPSGFVGVQAQTNAGTDATVLCLATDPVRTGVVYAGTDGGGVYQGTFSASGFLPFGNMAWQNVGSGRTGLANGYIRALAVDSRPNMNGILYAGTEQGLFRSTGSGGLWKARDGRGRIESELPSATANPLVFNLLLPARAQRARTVVTDNNTRRTDFVFDNSSTIRFLGAAPAAATLRVSYDYEQAIPDLVPITAVVVSPNSANNAVAQADNAIVYVATLGAGIFRSTNGGYTWMPINNGLDDTNVLTLAHARMPGNPNDVVLFAGTQSGLYKLAGGAAGAAARSFRVVSEATITDAQVATQLQWEPASRNLTATHVLALAVDPDQPAGNFRDFNLYAGTDVGGVFRTGVNLFDDTAANVLWAVATRNVMASNLSNTRVTSLSVDQMRNVWATTLDDDDPRNPIGGLFRSADRGVTFNSVASPLSGTSSPLQNTRLRAVASAAGNLLWVGGDGRQVWLSQRATSPDVAQVTFTEVGRIGSLNSGTITVNPELDNNIYDTTRVLFSGAPRVVITPLDNSNTLPIGGFQNFLLTISDQNGNPLPANTKVCITSSPKGTVSGGGTVDPDCTVAAGGSAAGVTLSDTQQGGTDFSFQLTNDLGVTTADASTSGNIGITLKVVATVYDPNQNRLSTAQDTLGRTLATSVPMGLTLVTAPLAPNSDEQFSISGGVGPFSVTVSGATLAAGYAGGKTFNVTTGGNGSQFTVSVFDQTTNEIFPQSYVVP